MDCVECPFINKLLWDLICPLERQFAFLKNRYVKRSILFLLCDSWRLLKGYDEKIALSYSKHRYGSLLPSLAHSLFMPAHVLQPLEEICSQRPWFKSKLLWMIRILCITFVTASQIENETLDFTPIIGKYAITLVQQYFHHDIFLDFLLFCFSCIQAFKKYHSPLS